MAAPNMSPGIAKEGAVTESIPRRQSENEEIESTISEYLLSAFLLLLMEFVKRYWSLELRAKLYNNIYVPVRSVKLFCLLLTRSTDSSQASPMGARVSQ